MNSSLSIFRHAPDVVLACGGFEGNREMLAKYIGNRTHELPLIAPGLVHNKGAGLNMALELGAATSGSFDGMHCELVDTRAKKPDAVIVSDFLRTSYAMSACLLSPSGVTTMALLSTSTASASTMRGRDISLPHSR